MTDQEAILAEGITLAEFPPLENVFDIVVNDFLPNPGGTLVGEYVFGITSSTNVKVSSTLNEAWTFGIASSTNVKVSSTLNEAWTFGIASAAAGSALSSLSESWTFDIASAAAGSALSSLSESWTFGVVHMSSVAAEVIAKANHSWTFNITHTSTARSRESIVKNYPVWPFEPNWSSTLTEVLEWLTDVMTSPTGSEQRRSLRYFPRRTFEFTLAAGRDERTLLDNLLVTYGAQRWYLPLWHDVNFLDVRLSVNGKIVICSTADTSEIEPGSIAVLIGDSPYDTELVEIEGVTSNGMTLVEGVQRAWPANTRIFPVRVARLTDQPQLAKRSDQVVTSEVRFQVVEATKDAGPEIVTDIYSNFFVLPEPPDDRQPLDHGIERMLAELDNQTSIPIWRDTAARPFTYEQYAWVLQGRAELRSFEDMLRSLRGRSQPIWVPTFMEDFVLISPIADGATTLTTARAGFTLAGGPRWDRQDIMIETTSGRIYRRITNSAVDSQGRETLLLDNAIQGSYSLDQIVRVCFMTLMRLNQDSVTIEHQTDSDGTATALATFRSAPDTRVPDAASF